MSDKGGFWVVALQQPLQMDLFLYEGFNLQ